MTEESRSLGCARCGDCCEDIFLGASMSDIVRWSTEALRDTPDPGDDEAWRTWWQDESRGNSWRDSMRDVAITRYDPAGDYRRNADFLTEHWREAGRDDTDYPYYSCDRFNQETRLCEARDERPPVCSGYPWYGRGPGPNVITKAGSRCSYLLDLPPEQRPKDARPLIPVEVIRG